LRYIFLSLILILFILILFGRDIKSSITNTKTTYRNEIKIITEYTDGKIKSRKYFHTNPKYEISCEDGDFISFTYRRCLPISTIEKLNESQL